MGANDLKEMDAGTMDPTGRGMTQGGKICGMIACILAILFLVLGILLVALGVFAGIHGQR